MSEQWGIEVQWGFKQDWTPFNMEPLPTKEEVERVIDSIREHARLPDCPMTQVAYRNLPMRSARR